MGRTEAAQNAADLDALLDSITADQEEAWQANDQYLADLAARKAARRAERAARYNVTTRYSIAPVATGR